MCRACRIAGHCVDEPTEDTAWELEDGIVVDRCPVKMMAPGTLELIELADIAHEHGTFPLAGGVLDQTESFLAGFDIYRAELSHWKAQAMSNG